MRGAGEKQLELDQRMIQARIKGINKSLTKVRGQREQGRRARKRAEVPTVSLVGYTNAGKSTLFNQLTKAQTFAADQLFATLDSTLRKVNLPSFGAAIMADTVGFISHLPHGLVEAFRATLEETAQANLLLHVIDASNEGHLEYVNEVNKVLAEIGADSVTQLEVMNKIDLTEESTPHIQRDESGKPAKVWVSAKTGAGMDLLLEAIGELLGGKMADEVLLIQPNKAKLRSQLYEQGYIEEEQINEEGLYQLRVRMPAQDLERLLNKGVAALLNTCTESHDVTGETAETLENNIHTATK
jgi:GTP-binding protein HflX